MSFTHLESRKSTSKQLHLPTSDDRLCYMHLFIFLIAQLIPLNKTIVSCQWCPSGNGAYLTLKTDQVVVISKL